MIFSGDGESENSDNGSGLEEDLVELSNQLSYISKPLEALRFSAWMPSNQMLHLFCTD